MSFESCNQGYYFPQRRETLRPRNATDVVNGLVTPSKREGEPVVCCGTETKYGPVDYTFRDGEKVVYIPDIYAEVCETCLAFFLHGQVLRAIAKATGEIT